MDQKTLTLFFVWGLLELSRRAAVHRGYMSGWAARNPEKKKANDAASYSRHKDSRLAGMRHWVAENPEASARIKRRHYVAHRDEALARAKKWQTDNRERRNMRLRGWCAEKQATDNNWRLRKNLATRVWWALRGGTKSSKTEALLGCSIPSLREFLAAKFQPGMSWDNYGEWHIDHIKPCASFDLTDREQQRVCFNFTNLQPLWAKDNLSKGAKHNAT